MSEQVTLEMIKKAAEIMKDDVRRTPIVTAKKISPNVFFKAECLQRTGSFKLRGAFNKIMTLTDEEAARGIVACSAGNHAQGVALAATMRGARSIVCMPEGAPAMKKEATAGYGAEVVPVPGIYDDAAAEAERLCKEEGYTFVHPFDDPEVIAGQGTLGLEILEQMPDVEQILVPIGGGGLVSGVAVAVKALKPECKVIGVQSSNVPSMYKSYANQKVMTIPDAKTFADGIHVLTPGSLTFELCDKYVDDIVIVDEDEICAAIVSMLEGPKLVSEGAGATGLAAFMFHKVDTSKKTVCIVSGGNVDLDTLSKIIEIGKLKREGFSVK
ncbi:MAG: pyridoxal-phosphate dependent enzyme [Clostridiales bacterium]|nr:pyridoxal-phosphate dependent enzyme [Candidatus Crickella equi]